LEKIEVLNNALTQKSSNFLHQKQAEFDKDYVDFMQCVAETRVSQPLYFVGEPFLTLSFN